MPAFSVVHSARCYLAFSYVYSTALNAGFLRRSFRQMLSGLCYLCTTYVLLMYWLYAVHFYTLHIPVVAFYFERSGLSTLSGFAAVYSEVIVSPA